MFFSKLLRMANTSNQTIPLPSQLVIQENNIINKIKENLIKNSKQFRKSETENYKLQYKNKDRYMK
tara:strand:+ start:2985 stop:3182 length:198 start_codon:yes stop_codon:yes gene_type:complete